ncbi:NAD(P)-dependent oxidoreductase [Chloroflexota bacterium]
MELVGKAKGLFREEKKRQDKEEGNMQKVKVAYIGVPNAQYMESLVESAPAGFFVKDLSGTADQGEMLRELEDADFLIQRRRIPDELYRACKRLKLLQLTSAGYDYVPMPVLREMGIPVANIGGANAIAVAEHVVTLMLMVLRQIIPSMVALRDGKWQMDMDENQYAELYQKTVGIVGLGNIGRWVGRIVSGFGAQVVFCDAFKMPLTMATLIPGTQVTLEKLLRIADIVSLNAPLNKDTQALIGRDELELMKPNAILINTCRGKVVDEAALIDALRQQRIAGAGLDVFEQEPIDLGNPLLQMEQVVCTPHIGGAAREKFPRQLSQIWGNFEAVLRGERPVSLVSTE